MERVKLSKREREVTSEFGALYGEMYMKIRDILDRKSEDELMEIMACFEKLDTTNCAWTSYAIKEIVLTDVFHALRNLKDKPEMMQNG